MKVSSTMEKAWSETHTFVFFHVFLTANAPSLTKEDEHFLWFPSMEKSLTAWDCNMTLSNSCDFREQSHHYYSKIFQKAKGLARQLFYGKL